MTVTAATPVCTYDGYWTNKHEIPAGCRKPRCVNHPISATMPVRAVTADDAPVVFRVTDTREPDHGVEYREYRGALYLPDLGRDTSYMWDGAPHPREWLARVAADAATRLTIDGTPWAVAPEPRYVVMTFGLGHNHGGTSLFAETHDNGNVLASNYYRADQFEQARDAAIATATGRGDTRDVPRLTALTPMIEVLSSAAVRLTVPPAETPAVTEARRAYRSALNALTEGSATRYDPYHAQREADPASIIAAEARTWADVGAARAALASLTDDIPGAYQDARPADRPALTVILSIHTDGGDDRVCLDCYAQQRRSNDDRAFTDLTGTADARCDHCGTISAPTPPPSR